MFKKSHKKIFISFFATLCCGLGIFASANNFLSDDNFHSASAASESEWQRHDTDSTHSITSTTAGISVNQVGYGCRAAFVANSASPVPIDLAGITKFEIRASSSSPTGTRFGIFFCEGILDGSGNYIPRTDVYGPEHGIAGDAVNIVNLLGDGNGHDRIGFYNSHVLPCDSDDKGRGALTYSRAYNSDGSKYTYTGQSTDGTLVYNHNSSRDYSIVFEVGDFLDIKINSTTTRYVKVVVHNNDLNASGGWTPINQTIYIPKSCFFPFTKTGVTHGEADYTNKTYLYYFGFDRCTFQINYYPQSYTYYTNNSSSTSLPNGVASLTCYRDSSNLGEGEIGTISNGDTIFYGDNLHWTATASSGYSISNCNNSSSANPYFVPYSEVNGTYITNVSATPNIYKVTFDKQSGSGGTDTAYVKYATGWYSNSTATTSITSISIPSRTGYSFGGYYTSTNGSGNQIINSSGTINSGYQSHFTANANLYAYWIPNVYTVTLDRQSGSGGIGTIYVKYATGWYSNSTATSSITSINKPTRSGYTFGGYYTDTDGNGTMIINSSGTIVSGKTSTFTADPTLYAKWTANTYTVTLNQQTGSGGTSSVTATYGSAMPSASAPSRTGYTFNGYYGSTGGVGTKYYNSNMSSAHVWDVAGAETIYAYWTANTYSISYVLNSGTHGTTHPTSATYDTPFYVSAPTRTGYNFTGWTVTSGLNTSTAKWGTTSATTESITSTSTKCVNGTSNVYFRSITATANGSVTLTANWSVKSFTYTTGELPTGVASLTCNRYSSPNGGGSTGTLSSGSTIYYGDKLYWTATASDGYSITTCNYNSTSSLYTVNSSNVVGVTATSVAATIQSYNLTLTINSGISTIYYKVNGAASFSSTTSNKTVSVTYGTTYYVYAVATSGYTLNSPYSSYSSSSPYSSTKTSSAETWSPTASANTYTVTLNKQSGTGGSSSVTATYGSAMPSATAPTRTGYTFGGFYDGEGGTGTRYYTDSMSSARNWDKTSNTTLYAKWTAKTSALTFNLNGGSGTAPTGKTATYGSAMPSYGGSAPTKAGYTFGGFYDGEGGTGTQYYTSSLTSARNWDKDTTSGTILYAKWTINTYTVTINVNDSTYGSVSTTSITSVPYGSTVTISNNTITINGTTVTANIKTAPSGYKYEFSSWSNAPATITGAVTITANFTGTSGEAAAISYASSFNTAISNVCNDSGNTNVSQLATAWATQKTNFEGLEEYVQYWVINGTDSTIVTMQTKYDYVYGKYGEDIGEDFLDRNPRVLSGVRSFTPFEVIGDNDEISSLVVIIASSIALLSITSLLTLLLKKKKIINKGD